MKWADELAEDGWFMIAGLANFGDNIEHIIIQESNVICNICKQCFANEWLFKIHHSVCQYSKIIMLVDRDKVESLFMTSQLHH